MLVFALFILYFAFFTNRNNIFNGVVFAETQDSNIEFELEETTDDLLNDLDFSELEDYLLEVDSELNLFDGLGFKEYVSLVINGKETIGVDKLFSIILENIKEGFRSFLTPIICVFVIALLCSLFNNFKSSKVTGVSEIIYFICFSISIIIISSITSNVIKSAKNSIDNVQKQMNAIFPILLSLITSMGGVVTVTALSPVLAFLTNVVSYIFVYILLPLFSLSLVLSIIGNLSDNIKLDKFNGFIKSTFKWIIGVVFAVFMGFLSIKGLTAGASDGLSIKATKYAIKNYIPMLGGYISEGFELVKAGSMLIKNATGVVGILLLFSSIITPILSVGVLELCLKLLAGGVEMVGDKKSSNLFYSIASSLKLLVVVLVGVALMYFLTMFLLICAASNFV